MNNVFTLVKMQLKDKIEFNIFGNKKENIRVFLIGIVKFLLIVAISAVLFIFAIKYAFKVSQLPALLNIVITLSMVLSLGSCIIGLTKSLYFSHDNKTLITLPVKSNEIYISKLLVFYIYELKKNIMFMVPICFGGIIALFYNGSISLLILLWSLIPILLIVSIPVLLAALISIPFVYVLRLFKKIGFLKVIFGLSIFILSIYLIIKVYFIIPNELHIVAQWIYISNVISTFLNTFELYNPIGVFIVDSMIGNPKINMVYTLVININTLYKVLILLGSAVILFFINFFISKPFFISMVSKSFEEETRKTQKKKNISNNKYYTFVIKERRMYLRDSGTTLNFVLTFVYAPLLLLLLNKGYQAFDKSYYGNIIVYACNALLILLPTLSCNSLASSLYSKEERSGYLKKTKPVIPYIPLLSKLIIPGILSTISVIASTIIFSTFSNFELKETVVLIFIFVFISLGHLLFSASLDILNPQNEQYATTGDKIDNPNERKSTIYAFIISFILAIFTFIIFKEEGLGGVNFNVNIPALYKGMIKILFIALLYFVSNVLFFIVKIKAFYYDKEIVKQ